MKLFEKYNDTEMMIVTKAAENLDDGSPDDAIFIGLCYAELERREILEDYAELRFALT